MRQQIILFIQIHLNHAACLMIATSYQWESFIMTYNVMETCLKAAEPGNIFSYREAATVTSWQPIDMVSTHPETGVACWAVTREMWHNGVLAWKVVFGHELDASKMQLAFIQGHYCTHYTRGVLPLLSHENSQMIFLTNIQIL